MTYSSVNTSASHEGELKGQLFAGAHRPEGVFNSLKGSALTPPELSFSDQGGNVGPDRLNQEVSTTGSWDSHVIVSTPMTHGGGTIAH